MRSRPIVLASILALSTSFPSFAYNHARRGPTSGLFKHKASKSTAHPTGPRVMEPQRATEIQEALIKAGYMAGSPSGHWDSDSQAAMQKLQAAKGWQTKLTPDSRALILLGLGPQQSKPSDTAQLSDTNVSTLSDGKSASGHAGFSLASID